MYHDIQCLKGHGHDQIRFFCFYFLQYFILAFLTINQILSANQRIICKKHFRYVNKTLAMFLLVLVQYASKSSFLS